MEKLHTTELFLEKNNFWDFKSKYEFMDQWHLMGSFYPVLTIIAAYLIFVLKLGPEYMKNRRPFQLRSTLILYNAIQVAVSAIMFSWSLKLVLKDGIFHPKCIVDKSKYYDLHAAGYCYFLCKISELLDTVFFVLRKKNNQVTFLHVYHHAMMALSVWFFLKFDPAHWMLCLGVLNCFVHVVMYAYYGLSAYPKLHKYLWWKKYITSMQLIQFVLLILHLTIALYINECKPSKITVLFFYANTFLFLYLFSDFYAKTYTKKEVDDLKNAKHKNALNDTATSSKASQNGNSYSNGILSGKPVTHSSVLKNGSPKTRRRV